MQVILCLWSPSRSPTYPPPSSLLPLPSLPYFFHSYLLPLPSLNSLSPASPPYFFPPSPSLPPFLLPPLTSCSNKGLTLETSANTLFTAFSISMHQPYVDTSYILPLCRCRPKLVLTGTKYSIVRKFVRSLPWKFLTMCFTTSSVRRGTVAKLLYKRESIQ